MAKFIRDWASMFVFLATVPTWGAWNPGARGLVVVHDSIHQQTTTVFEMDFKEQKIRPLWSTSTKNIPQAIAQVLVVKSATQNSALTVHVLGREKKTFEVISTNYWTMPRPHLAMAPYDDVKMVRVAENNEIILINSSHSHFVLDHGGAVRVNQWGDIRSLSFFGPNQFMALTVKDLEHKYLVRRDLSFQLPDRNHDLNVLVNRADPVEPDNALMVGFSKTFNHGPHRLSVERLYDIKAMPSGRRAWILAEVSGWRLGANLVVGAFLVDLDQGQLEKAVPLVLEFPVSGAPLSRRAILSIDPSDDGALMQLGESLVVVRPRGAVEVLGANLLSSGNLTNWWLRADSQNFKTVHSLAHSSLSFPFSDQSPWIEGAALGGRALPSRKPLGPSKYPSYAELDALMTAENNNLVKEGFLPFPENATLEQFSRWLGSTAALKFYVDDVDRVGSEFRQAMLTQLDGLGLQYKGGMRPLDPVSGKADKPFQREAFLRLLAEIQVHKSALGLGSEPCEQSLQ